jgi:2-C-methyl-D-erythritol 4-phosphate cytidylyltransferase
VSSWAIVVAAGSGNRFGRLKQYELMRGRTVLDWSLDAARQACDGVVAVVTLDDPDRSLLAADAVVGGGATRADSVRAGLAAVPDDATIVVVHDGARPLASPKLFQTVMDEVLAGADGAVPGLDVSDTLKMSVGGVVTETVARDGLVTVQTPQAFRAEALRLAHRGSPQASDDAALLESIGLTVRVVAGDRRNIKVTDPGDVELADRWMCP